MKNNLFSVFLLMMGLTTNFFCSCNHDKTIPVVSTTNVSDIFATSVKVEGNVINDGGYDITARGICWSTNCHPTTRLPTKAIVYTSGLGSFSCYLTGLKPGTSYFVRSYAANLLGTAYGEEFCFTTTYITGTVTDIDGNVYHVLQIGSQTWMVENLKSTRYRDSTAIPHVAGTDWCSGNKGAYCIYDNNPENGPAFGYLYNWYAVNDKRSIAPIGWHVPTNEEWTTLVNYLGGVNVAGGALKSTNSWLYPNTGATNESGFSALPGGFRSSDSNGAFHSVWEIGRWWSSTEDLAHDNSVYFWALDYLSRNVDHPSGDKHYGFYVRCIKDN